MVVIDGTAPVAGRTSDLSPTGVSLTMGNMVKAGQQGQVSFEMLVDGKPTIINTRAKVMYCIFSGDDVKVGFQFINPDPATLAAIAKFMR